MDTVPYSTELELAFETSFEKEPTSYSWGFFAYDDTPGAAGGGVGNFSWFDSQNEFLAFLKKFPLLTHNANSDQTEVFAKAQAHLANVTGENFDQKVVDELNKLIAGIEQIQWFGQFNDLLTGDGEFATGLRKFSSGSPEKIAKSRIPEFAEFLRGWGH